MSGTEMRRRLVEALEERGRRHPSDWAFQGEPDARERWASATDRKDLDLWVRDERVATALGEVIASFGGVRVSREPTQPRVRHQAWWLRLDDNDAVVDITVGSLGAGPLTVVPAERVVATEGALQGEALVFDLIGRKLLSGKLPSEGRIELGQRAFVELIEEGEHLKGWPRPVRKSVQAVLEGDRSPIPVWRSRIYLVVRSLQHPLSSFKNRHEILGRQKSPLTGLAARGVVVAFIGVDGSGKSTLLEEVSEQMRALGWEPKQMYLGMIRGNLAGVEKLRKVAYKLLGYSNSSNQDSAERKDQKADLPEKSLPENRPPEKRGIAERALRWAAAWAYAIDLLWRVRKARRAARGGGAVLCDRWSYDLALDPSPGHPAARLLARIHPDVLVFCDGNIAAIAARKDPGDLDERKARQDHYRRCAEKARAAGRVDLRLDTVEGPGPTADAARVVAAVVAASHLAEFTGEK